MRRSLDRVSLQPGGILHLPSSLICPIQVRAVAARRPDPTVCISGLSGEGMMDLLDLISLQLSKNMEEMDVLLPYPQVGKCNE